MTPKTVEFRSTIDASAEDVMRFHEGPQAFQRLTPPPVFVRIHRDERESLTTGEVAFTLWFGPIPVRWTAEHAPGPTEMSFVDRQIAGPMAFWEHEHIFQPTEEGVELIDRLQIAHKPGWRGWLTRLAFDGLPLRLLFWYRHWRTKRAVT